MLKFNGNVCEKVSTETSEKAQQTITKISEKVFGIKGKAHIEKDTAEFTYVIKTDFWNRLLPKSKRRYTKTVYRTGSDKKLEESVFKGQNRLEYTKWNEKNEVTYHETFNPKTNEKVEKTLMTNGKYDEIRTVNGVIRYKTSNGVMNWHEYEIGYLLNMKSSQNCYLRSHYAENGDLLKREYILKHKNTQGKEQEYVAYVREGQNITEYNPDGSVKSRISYRKEKDSWHSYEKNPYWEYWTHTDANGNEIGKYIKNLGGTVYKERTITTETGRVTTYSDYRKLKAHGKIVLNNDGSSREEIRYFKSGVGHDYTDIRTKSKDGSKTFQTLKGNIETHFQKLDKYGHLILERYYDVGTKTTVEKHFSYGNILGGIKGSILEKIKITKNINGRDETRYFDGNFQRINPDGTKYKYSSEQERAAEWYKQEKETDYKTGGENNSSRTRRPHTTSAGNNETRDEFIIRIRDFLSNRGRKVLNERDLRNLAAVLGVDNPQLLMKLGDSTNRDAKILYRILCKKYHPDTNGNDPVKQNLFIIVQNLRTLS